MIGQNMRFQFIFFNAVVFMGVSVCVAGQAERDAVYRSHASGGESSVRALKTDCLAEDDDREDPGLEEYRSVKEHGVRHREDKRRYRKFVYHIYPQATRPVDDGTDDELPVESRIFKDHASRGEMKPHFTNLRKEVTRSVTKAKHSSAHRFDPVHSPTITIHVSTETLLCCVMMTILRQEFLRR